MIHLKDNSSILLNSNKISDDIRNRRKALSFNNLEMKKNRLDELFC